MQLLKTLLIFCSVAAAILIPSCSDSCSETTWPLKQSADKRYLVDQNDQPFFISAETAWKLMNALTTERMDDYLDNCVENGFNSVMFVFRPFQGTTDAYGNLPFEEDDITRPNEPFWANVDSLVVKARKRDMLLFGVMLWHKDDQNAEDGNRRNPLKYTVEQCRQLGHFLGSRYHPENGMDNLIFVGGGDKRPGPDAAKFEAMARAVLEENPEALITYHSYHPRSSCDEWGYPDWLGLNAVYNYQPPHSPEWFWQEARNNWKDHASEMPIMLYEGLYEHASRKGYHGTPANIRKQHWWAVTSGCTAGHAVDHFRIWRMENLEEQLEDEARTDMKHIRLLMESLEWWKREPDLDNQLLTGGLGRDERRATACIADDGSYAIIYSPNTEDPEVDLLKLNGPVEGKWYDPENGTYQELDLSLTSEALQIIPRPDTSDWVLILKTR